MIRPALILGLLLLPIGGAKAGDTAQLNILGFSPDGALFAFEEFGIQDGSGFPYTNRFYVRTADDSFVDNTPIRSRLEDQGRTVSDARRDARGRGQAVLSDDLLAANPGFTVGSLAVTQKNVDPLKMTVNPRPVFPPIDPDIDFVLEQKPLTPPKDCAGLGAIVGFKLTMTKAGGQSAVINDDEGVPSSRGCPSAYRIAAVQTFYPVNGAPVFAVVVDVERYGFEGPDHRYIAVTGKL